MGEVGSAFPAQEFFQAQPFSCPRLSVAVVADFFAVHADRQKLLIDLDLPERVLPLEESFHLQYQLVQIARFEQEVVGPRAEGFDRQSHIALPGEDDYAGVVIEFFNLVQHLDTVDAVHNQVGYHHIGGVGPVCCKTRFTAQCS